MIMWPAGKAAPHGWLGGGACFKAQFEVRVSLASRPHGSPVPGAAALAHVRERPTGARARGMRAPSLEANVGALIAHAHSLAWYSRITTGTEVGGSIPTSVMAIEMYFIGVTSYRTLSNFRLRGGVIAGASCSAAWQIGASLSEPWHLPPPLEHPGVRGTSC